MGAIIVLNVLFALLRELSGDRQGALAFIITTNIWLAAYTYGGKRGSAQAGGEKR